MSTDRMKFERSGYLTIIKCSLYILLHLRAVNRTFVASYLLLIVFNPKENEKGTQHKDV